MAGAPFFGFVPPPRQMLTGLEGLGQVAQGLGQFHQNNLFKQDLQNLRTNPQGFTPQSQQGQQMFAQMQFQNQALASQPVTPLEREKLDISRQAAGVLTPSAQTAKDKRDARLIIEGKMKRGEDVTEDIKRFKTLFGGGQEINIDLGRTSPAEREALAKGRATVDALDNLRTLHDNPKARSGPLVGRVDPLLGLVGGTTEEQEAFLAATSSFKNQIIQEITGAQMGEKEATRIQREIPLETDPPKRWQAKWEQTRNNRIRIAKRRAEVLRQSDIKVPEDVQELANQKERPLSSTAKKELQSIHEPPQKAPVITNTTEFEKLKPGTEYIFNNERFIKGK